MCCNTKFTKKMQTTIELEVSEWPVQLPESMPTELSGMTAESTWKDFAKEFNEEMQASHDTTKQYVYSLIAGCVFFLACGAYGASAGTIPLQVVLILLGLGLVSALASWAIHTKWGPSMFATASSELCRFCTEKVVSEGKVVFDLTHEGQVKGSCVGCIGERNIPLLQVTSDTGDIEAAKLTGEPKQMNMLAGPFLRTTPREKPKDEVKPPSQLPTSGMAKSGTGSLSVTSKESSSGGPVKSGGLTIDRAHRSNTPKTVKEEALPAQ